MDSLDGLSFLTGIQSFRCFVLYIHYGDGFGEKIKILDLSINVSKDPRAPPLPPRPPLHRILPLI